MEHVITEMLQNFEQGKISRRQLIQGLALAATAASAATAAPAAVGSSPMKATYINHVGCRVADYTRSRDWYAELFGMKVMLDDGVRANLAVGESLIIFQNRKNPTAPPVDHVSFTIANWDTDKSVREAVAAEIKRRGIEVRVTECCLHIKDPDGFDLQLGGKDQGHA
jgi:catechol 2,3-dioxygenase-like lactoylglutathione lyase family enzyme